MQAVVDAAGSQPAATNLSSFQAGIAVGSLWDASRGDTTRENLVVFVTSPRENALHFKSFKSFKHLALKPILFSALTRDV